MPRTDFVHGCIVGHIHEINVHLDNILEAASGFLQDVLDVFDDLFLCESVSAKQGDIVLSTVPFCRPLIPQRSCWWTD
jgi:hypothetical protein